MMRKKQEEQQHLEQEQAQNQQPENLVQVKLVTFLVTKSNICCYKLSLLTIFFLSIQTTIQPTHDANTAEEPTVQATKDANTAEEPIVMTSLTFL